MDCLFGGFTMFIDIHCHIINQIDDGPTTKDESIEMLKTAKNYGIEIIAATSHFSSTFKREYKKRLSDINDEAEDIGVKLICGCEYTLNNVIEEEEIVSIGNSDYVLMEIKEGFLSEFTFNKIYSIMLKGYSIILAHPERSFFDVKASEMKKLKQMGVYFQITAGSLLGEFGEDSKKNAFYLIENGLCEVVASDSHEANNFVNMKKAYQKICKVFNKDFADVLLYKNPKCIVENKPIDSLKPVKRRFIYNFLRL